MITKARAQAAKARAMSAARKTYHLVPTSISTINGPSGWYIYIGLPADPGNLGELRQIDGVPVKVEIIGPAVRHA